MCVPPRHDLLEWSCLNSETKVFNRKLSKLLKPFNHVVVVIMTDSDRKFYTRHGLHMNNLGKEETATKISMIISRVFQKQNVKIHLCWKYGYNVSVKRVSNQSEGTSVKKVDENPTEGTISLHEAQDQPAIRQELNLNATNIIQS